MRRFPTTRPSPALIVAMIALVLALAGTALAGGTAAKITKSKVKTIAAKQINKLAPGLEVNSAKTATTADSAKTATTAGIASNILSANVLASGATLGSIPAGVTSSKVTGNPGTYEVVFPRSIAGCNLSASAGSATSQLPVLVGVAPKVNVPNTVGVFTRSSANVASDQDFYVQAICPG
jgi:hypothetical protein